ncbi:hypothetical protein ACYOEI_21900 [Singulisphaera rosea]
MPWISSYRGLSTMIADEPHPNEAFADRGMSRRPGGARMLENAGQSEATRRGTHGRAQRHEPKQAEDPLASRSAAATNVARPNRDNSAQQADWSERAF